MLVDLRPGLRTYLLSVSAISSMVGGSRIYPVRMKEGVREDSIVYFQTVETETFHFQAPTGLVGARMQIDAWSQSTDSARRLGDLVKDALNGYSGLWPYGASSPSDLVNVQGTFALTGFEDYDQEAQLYRMSRDYQIMYEQK